MRRFMILSLGLSLCWLSAADSGERPKEGFACQDTSAIRWFFPGQFGDARAHAEKGKRILMVKGISFGVDEVGAKCATKGNW